MTSSRHFCLVALMIPTVLHSKNPNSFDTPINATHSDLVLINTLVTDRQGRAITGLDASKFRLTEDGKDQVVRYCVSEDVPVSIGLVLDTSGNMRGRLAMLKQAAVQFVRAGNPANEYFLIQIRDRPRMVLPFTADLT
jgi:VWFA-related protein